ncbi:MAG: peptidoglycan bridge formation glycyltransferase FemA/FemB family protein [Chloroflexota bacterium]|nr:peptidoglycan bridge formation glycyltransferase FemA/FemB family protein [Chloroflexota bacterium]
MLNAISPATPDWDAFVRQHPRAHALQLSAWGALKHAYGWEVERVALAQDGQIIAGAQLLFRRLPLRLGTMAYLGMGPLLPPLPSEKEPEDKGTNALWAAIHACARRHRAVFLKCEPGIYAPDEIQPDMTDFGFRPALQSVQPPRTIVIDITGSDEEILGRMNQGTRRKIRQSQKNDVRYSEGTRADVAKFNSIMQTTGERNDFGVHTPDYYERAYDLFVPHDAALLLAEHEGDVLAGVMVFAVGTQAWYLYGASSSVKRNLMASYGAQWAAIQWAKARGCTRYDLWGIPDEEEATLEAQFEQRADGLWGVYGFKRGWGGSVMRSVGAWDYVYNPIIYAAYRAAVKYRGSE